MKKVSKYFRQWRLIGDIIMKKNYVKPMMESEAFVANEYVAACWTITCTNSDANACGGIEKIKDKELTDIGGLNAQYNESSDSYLGTYTGTMPGNKQPCKNQLTMKDFDFDWGLGALVDIDFYKFLWALINDDLYNNNPVHPVAVSEGYYLENKFHPKASV